MHKSKVNSVYLTSKWEGFLCGTHFSVGVLVGGIRRPHFVRRVEHKRIKYAVDGLLLIAVARDGLDVVVAAWRYLFRDLCLGGANGLGYQLHEV